MSPSATPTFDQTCYTEKFDDRDSYSSTLLPGNRGAPLAVGDNIIVGDPENNQVFVYNPGNPVPVQTIVGPASSDKFGAALDVSIANERQGLTVLVISDPGDKIAYVYVAQNNNPGNPDFELRSTATRFDSDGFGESVAVSRDGDHILIGAPFEDDAKGKVYLYEKGNGNWPNRALNNDDLVETFVDEAPFRNERFGTSVDFDHAQGTDDFVIGVARDRLGGGNRPGIAFYYAGPTTTSSGAVTVTPDDPEHNSRFGTSLSLVDETLVVAAPNDRTPGRGRTGSVVIFQQESTIFGSTFQESQTLVPEDTVRPDGFGDSVVLCPSGNVLLVGAPFDDNFQGEDAGAVFVYVRSNVNRPFEFDKKVMSCDSNEGQRFGLQVACTANDIGATITTFDPFSVEDN